MHILLTESVSSVFHILKKLSSPKPSPLFVLQHMFGFRSFMQMQMPIVALKPCSSFNILLYFNILVIFFYFIFQLQQISVDLSIDQLSVDFVVVPVIYSCVFVLVVTVPSPLFLLFFLLYLVLSYLLVFHPCLFPPSHPHCSRVVSLWYPQPIRSAPGPADGAAASRWEAASVQVSVSKRVQLLNPVRLLLVFHLQAWLTKTGLLNCLWDPTRSWDSN